MPRSDPECGFARSGAESHAEEQATRAFRPIVQARAQCTDIASTAHNAVRSLTLPLLLPPQRRADAWLNLNHTSGSLCRINTGAGRAVA